MSANQTPWPGAVDTRRASLDHAGQMARWLAIDATHGGFAHSGTGEQRRIYVPLATAALAGAMSAADKAKEDAATAANTASTIVMRDAGGNINVTNIQSTYWNGQLAAQLTDANGWTLHRDVTGKAHWYKQLTVNAGWPAATAWSPMVSTTNLPVGVASLAAVRLFHAFMASVWSRVMTIEPDAVAASTVVQFHGTLAAGPGNWNAINPVVVIDVELVEK
jgi:hypothetical protein